MDQKYFVWEQLPHQRIKKPLEILWVFGQYNPEDSIHDKKNISKPGTIYWQQSVTRNNVEKIAHYDMIQVQEKMKCNAQQC